MFVSVPVFTLQSNQGALQSNVGTLQSNVGTLQSNVGTLQSNVGTLQSNMGTLHSNVGTLQSQVRLTLYRFTEPSVIWPRQFQFSSVLEKDHSKSGK